jgi:hypothetical protein
MIVWNRLFPTMVQNQHELGLLPAETEHFLCGVDISFFHPLLGVLRVPKEPLFDRQNLLIVEILRIFQFLIPSFWTGVTKLTTENLYKLPLFFVFNNSKFLSGKIEQFRLVQFYILFKDQSKACLRLVGVGAILQSHCVLCCCKLCWRDLRGFNCWEDGS